jgi:hypothetical protein
MRRFFLLLLAAIFALAGVVPVHGQAVLLLEEPFGEFGRFNPTGHAAIYLTRVCAETPVMLRRCEPGELGTVISRYHRVDGYDWIATPLVPYLYAVDDVGDIPLTANRSLEAELRDSYRREHLEALAPDTPNGKAPGGEWIQLVGASYDRRIYGFEVPTTEEQDDRLIREFNARRNHAHFNLFFHNCADFARSTIDRYYYPHAMRRNWIADAGMTTPKQLVRSLERTSKKRGVPLKAFVIPQVPGSIPRSTRVDGVLEAFLKRKYVLPVAVLHPIIAGSLALAYLSDGRFDLPKDPTVLDVTALSEAVQQEAAMKTGESPLTLTVMHAPLLSQLPQPQAQSQKTEGTEEPANGNEKTMTMSVPGSD